MGKLASNASNPIKALILGDSGTGKTGSLWSLAAAGFKLKICDFDANHGILTTALGNNQEAIDNVSVEVFRDRLKTNIAGFLDGNPVAWSDFLKAMNKWPDGGSLAEWGTDTVLVIDTLTSVGKAALHKAQKLESKFGRLPEIQHYHTAMVQIEGLLNNLASDQTQCHVLILTHIDYQKSELGAMFGLPMAIGEKLCPKVPIYFNTMLAIERAQITGKTSLSTKPTAMVQTKVEAFNRVRESYGLVDGKKSLPGLAEFFADVGFPGTEKPT